MTECPHSPFNDTRPCAAEIDIFLNKITPFTALHFSEGRTQRFFNLIQYFLILHLRNPAGPSSIIVFQNEVNFNFIAHFGSHIQ